MTDHHQSGKTAQSLTDTLTREASSSEDIEDLIVEYQRSRGPQSNISFFAFTATPRNVTWSVSARWGRTDSQGLSTFTRCARRSRRGSSWTYSSIT